nr:hypothetical protein [Tanacetum cinerariifolium]
MHNNIMAAGSRDRLPMLTTGRYAQWQLFVPATADSSAVPKRTAVETILTTSPENKAHCKSEKEAIHFLLTGIGDEIYSTVDASKTAHEMKPKRVKDSLYHKEKMLLCKQAKKDVLLQAEKADWLEDTNEEIDEQELEAYYSFMAKIQQHSEQPESTSNTCLVEKDDSNVTHGSPDMCDNDIQTDQNAEDEHDVLANLSANLKLDVDENKKDSKAIKESKCITCS